MSSYIPIASQTLNSSAANVVFSSIPTALNGKTLRDLVLVCEFTTAQAATARVVANNDFSSYPFTGIGGNTTSPVWTGTSVAEGFVAQEFGSSSSTERVLLTFHIMDYATTNKQKVCLARGNNASRATELIKSRWVNTAAITSLFIYNSGNSNFQTGSTFSLYGIEG